jgi:hypothetical protein
MRFNSTGSLVWQEQITGANYFINTVAEHSDGSSLSSEGRVVVSQ